YPGLGSYPTMGGYSGIGSYSPMGGYSYGNPLSSLYGPSRGSIPGLGSSPTRYVEVVRMHDQYSPGALKVWDLEKGKETIAQDGGMEARAYNSDGSQVAAARGETVTIKHAATGQNLHTFTGNPAPVHAMSFAPEGGLMAVAGAGGLVRLYDPAGGREVH